MPLLDDIFFAEMFGSWLMTLTAWIFFRKPDLPFLPPAVLNPFRPSDYFTPTGVVIFVIGASVFMVGWLFAFGGGLR